MRLEKEKLHNEAMNVLDTKLAAMDLKQYPKFKKWEGSENVWGSLIDHNSNFYSGVQKSMMNKNTESILHAGLIKRKD